MKPKFFSVIILLLSCFLPMNIMAQKGEKFLGLGGGYATYNNGGYAKVNFQYTILRHLRVSPEVSYVFKKDGKSAFAISADIHSPFRVYKGISLYPLAGVTLNNWSMDSRDNITRIGADFGGGLDIYLTSNLKINLQGKYSLLNTCGGGFIDMGVGYVF